MMDVLLVITAVSLVIAVACLFLALRPAHAALVDMTTESDLAELLSDRARTAFLVPLVTVLLFVGVVRIEHKQRGTLLDFAEHLDLLRRVLLPVVVAAFMTIAIKRLAIHYVGETLFDTVDIVLDVLPLLLLAVLLYWEVLGFYMPKESKIEEESREQSS